MAVARGIVAALVALAAFALSAKAGADSGERPPPASATDDERRAIFVIQVENDVFNRFSPTDRDYTNGIRLGWLSPALVAMPPTWVALTTIPTFFREPPSDSVIRRFGIAVGQNIYTPADTLNPFPILQRPAL